MRFLALWIVASMASLFVLMIVEFNRIPWWVDAFGVGLGYACAETFRLSVRRRDAR